MESIQQRLISLQQRIPANVTLIGVSKEQPLEKNIEAYHLGLRNFGENKAQDLKLKVEAFRTQNLTARWHFIGRLQRNKVSLILEYADVLHTLDRLELLEALVKNPVQRTKPLEIFVQVNIGNEPQKGGIAPDEAVDFALQILKYDGLKLCGFMAIPPVNEPPEPYFKALHQLLLILQKTAPECQSLSMGMSSDFDQAIRCGATHVRVGELLFGPRHT